MLFIITTHNQTIGVILHSPLAFPPFLPPSLYLSVSPCLSVSSLSVFPVSLLSLSLLLSASLCLFVSRCLSVALSVSPCLFFTLSLFFPVHSDPPLNPSYQHPTIGHFRLGAQTHIKVFQFLRSSQSSLHIRPKSKCMSECMYKLNDI